MKNFFFICLLNVSTVFLFNPDASGGDIGTIFCQGDSRGSDLQQETCRGYILGILDTLESIGYYCPDGATSAAHIIHGWHVLLKADTTLKSLPSAESIMLALEKLGQTCPEPGSPVRTWKK